MSDTPLPPDPRAARFAAALHYRDGMDAPVLTARGHGRIADEIVRRGQEAGVPVHASRELAALLAHADLDRPVPPQLYRVVAELFVWLYQLDRDRQMDPTRGGD